MSEPVDEEVIVANAALGGEENYDDAEFAIDESKLGERLVQVNRQKGCLREFQLYDDRYLLVTVGDMDGKSLQKYRVNLAWISAEPTHERFIDWKWLVITLVLGSIASTFAVLGVLQILTMDYVMIGGTITFTLTMLTLLIFLYRRRDEFTFHGFVGDASLFVMENRRPTQQVFDAFYVRLQQCVDHSRNTVTMNERLVGELKMCRRLRDESIIDEQAYTDTRTRIFAHEEYRA